MLCPDKVTTDEWLEAHRTAHARRPALEHHDHVRRRRAAGVTGPATWCRTRDLQQETGGFTEFVPLPFVHMAAPDLPAAASPAGARPSGRRCSCTPWPASPTAGCIDNIQVSWVKMGADGARQAPAGRRQRPRRHPHGREHLAGPPAPATASAWTEDDFRPIVEPLGRPLDQRTTLYEPVAARRL